MDTAPNAPKAPDAKLWEEIRAVRAAARSTPRSTILAIGWENGWSEAALIAAKIIAPRREPSKVHAKGGH